MTVGTNSLPGDNRQRTEAGFIIIIISTAFIAAHKALLVKSCCAVLCCVVCVCVNLPLLSLIQTMWKKKKSDCSHQFDDGRPPQGFAAAPSTQWYLSHASSGYQSALFSSLLQQHILILFYGRKIRNKNDNNINFTEYSVSSHSWKLAKDILLKVSPFLLFKQIAWEYKC